MKRDVGLVVEGGGMRGAYAAGALVAAHDSLGDQIGGIFATSSGASSAAYVASGQREGISIWRDHLHGSRLIRPAGFLIGRPALDVGYLIDTVFGRNVPLDVDAVRTFPGPFDVTATRADTGDVHYFDMHRAKVLEALRAAVSLPGAVRTPVLIDGVPYVDGGLTDPIPVRRALQAGFRKLVVILTRPEGYRKAPASRMSHFLLGRDFPQLRDPLRKQHERYNDALDLVAAPPDGVTLTPIRPGSRLHMSRWTRSRKRLLQAIDAGLADARNRLAAHS